jgi:tRNA G18 (ribose-2'-O)-methylase SpoU
MEDVGTAQGASSQTDRGLGREGAYSVSHSTKSNEHSITPLLDAPDLDLRLIRKAEGVIQCRTGSELIIVVERCTNDHNYSAILRTAEALGIQNVWLIDPPPMTDGTTPAAVRANVQTKDDGETAQQDSSKLHRAYVPALKISEQELDSRRKHRLNTCRRRWSSIVRISELT